MYIYICLYKWVAHLYVVCLSQNDPAGSIMRMVIKVTLDEATTEQRYVYIYADIHEECDISIEYRSVYVDSYQENCNIDHRLRRNN